MNCPVSIWIIYFSLMYSTHVWDFFLEISYCNWLLNDGWNKFLSLNTRHLIQLVRLVSNTGWYASKSSVRVFSNTGWDQALSSSLQLFSITLGFQNPNTVAERPSELKPQSPVGRFLLLSISSLSSATEKFLLQVYQSNNG